MKFIESSADIPSELIHAVNDGDVVFLCGAGVSLDAGLPLFQELTDDVYKSLGESKANEAAERIAYLRTEYDRVLRSLEKRTLLPGTDSRVRAAVADRLAPPVGANLSRHLSLLRLSRDRSDRPRIITTNFDTLFERAAHEASIPFASHAVKSIPRPGSPRDYGVFRLLAAILLANQAGKAGYALTTSEVRSILRRAGHSSLSSFAHRLAIEMESANSQQKRRVWSEIVGPVFRGAWPLDIELQTPRATFKLVQILLATGSAFSDAATMIIPFIRSESPRDHTSIYSISNASLDLYKEAPQKMLDLLSAIAGDAPDRSLYGLSSALNRLQEVAPQLAQTKQFQSLATQATPY